MGHHSNLFVSLVEKKTTENIVTFCTLVHKLLHLLCQTSVGLKLVEVKPLLPKHQCTSI